MKVAVTIEQQRLLGPTQAVSLSPRPILACGAQPAVDPFGNRGFKVLDDEFPEFGVFRVPDLFDLQNACLVEHIGGKRVFVLVDPVVDLLYARQIQAYFDAYGIEHVNLTLERQEFNENNKSLEVMESLAVQMHLHDPGKDDLLLLIGGGVVMDSGGFLASVYRRGLNYISIPTTLLAIVDASISPKTAINVGGFKNLLGTKHPPKLVLYDPQLLRSLPHHDFCSGMAEVLKVAIVGDKKLFGHLSETPVNVLKEEVCGERGSSIVEDAIEVFLDLKWTGPYYGNRPASIRAFGHGFSRELETASHFALAHGQAVAIEMAGATRLSFDRGILSASDMDRIFACFLHLNLPTHCACLDPQGIWKKVFEPMAQSGKNFYFPIPKEIGVGAFLDHFTQTELADAIEAARSHKFSSLCRSAP